MKKCWTLLMRITLLFLLVVIMTACSSTDNPPIPSVNLSPTLKLTPTLKPTPIPMVRITIQLVDVFCHAKQAAFGFHDNFYMMATFATPRSSPQDRRNVQSQLFKPLDITNQQDLPVPQSPLIVFDGVVPQHGSVAGGFIAYNDTKGLAWSNINSWVASIAQIVGDELFKQSFDSGSIPLIVAAGVLDLATHVWYGLANLDSTSANKLGEQDLTVLADGPSSEDEVLTFYNAGGFLGIGGWNYTATYHITRSLVLNGTTPSDN